MPNNHNQICRLCNEQTRSYGTQIQCANCQSRFHVQCCPISSREFNQLSERGIDWFCNGCNENIFPFGCLNDNDVIDLFDIFKDQTKMPQKKLNVAFVLVNLFKIIPLLCVRSAHLSII